MRTGSELPVTGQPHHELPAADHHPLHERTFQATPTALLEKSEAAAHSSIVNEAQEREASLALVQDAGDDALESHREPQFLGGTDRLVRAVRQPALHHGDTVGPKQFLGFALRQ